MTRPLARRSTQGPFVPSTAGRSIRAELHCHTVYSPDGHIEFEALLRQAARRRLDVVAVTDHDTIQGALEFRRRCKRLGAALEIVVGEERTLADGTHLIGLFLHEPISSAGFAEAVREIQEQNALCILPHPFRRGDGALRRPGRVLGPRPLGLEIFNPKCSYQENAEARELALVRGGGVGGSDAHYQAELGECVTLLAWSRDPRESLVGALRGTAPVRVLGVRQMYGAAGRQYAHWYYRLKPVVRVPRRWVPAANRLYRFYLDSVVKLKEPVLEEKYVRE